MCGAIILGGHIRKGLATCEAVVKKKAGWQPTLDFSGFFKDLASYTLASASDLINNGSVKVPSQNLLRF
jgi:hypothetical protein